ncbi:MAG: hypothetical protein KC488_13000 [Candidatus Cloacimonetes bacterium]|nr:hypothetical protein [Candidatus Cloacimonadota bacterium]
MRALTLIAIGLLAVGAHARGLGQLLMDPELNLKTDQASQIETTLDQHRLEMVQLQADLKKARMELDMALKSDASLGTMEKKADEITKAEGMVLKSRLKVHVAVRKNLDETQQAIFDRKYSSLDRPGKGRGGKGRGGPGPGWNADGPRFGPHGPGRCGAGPCGPAGPSALPGGPDLD